jgi:hypothetical protein
MNGRKEWENNNKLEGWKDEGREKRKILGRTWKRER